MPLQIARRFVVIWLERLCTGLDLIGYDHLTHKHRLALLSDRLDEQWNTGVWHRMTSKTHPTCTCPADIDKDGPGIYHLENCDGYGSLPDNPPT